ncbi:cupin 2 domain-containing protein [Calothrix sp. NIES-4071]|nr:cupin 2 domain-containing protein [Calothrix sp. NIES-4071]BAZ59080.1 cupin 2 domain-containing protein [Calothrix sp. NIES-4105]
MKKNKHTAKHYLWGNNCHGWHLVKQPELSIIQEEMAPNTSEVRHYHQHSRQFFFILCGEATIEVNGRRQVLRAHEGLEILPGQTHQVFNESQQNIEFIVVSQPPSHEDKILCD